MKERARTDAVASIQTTAERQLYADPKAAGAQAVDKIAAARVWLLKEKPFFGVLARALTVEPTLMVPAFRLSADDRLRVNPLVVLELRFPSLCARLAHLALHAALGAFARRAHREPLRWNAAHDLAVEPLLRAAGLGSGADLRDVAVDLPPGASAEEVFACLPEGARPDDLWCDITDPPPRGDAPPAGQFTRQDSDTGDDDGSGDKGGGGDGDPEPDDDAPDDPDASDEPSQMEMRSRELAWKMRLAAALEEELASGGKTFGEAPAWIEELVRATIEPPPSFHAVLQRAIATLSRSGRTFLRPSRRMSALVGPSGEWPDVVSMPGRRVVPAGRLVSVVDTSASIDTALLSRFLGALAASATAEGFDEIRLLQADAEVTSDVTVSAAELYFQPIVITGRGGTHYGPALQALARESKELGERFMVVYLTDLDGRFPSAAGLSHLTVLWVVPHEVREAPPFGEVIVVR